MGKRYFIFIVFLSYKICNGQFASGLHLVDISLSAGYQSSSSTEYPDISISSIYYSSRKIVETYIGIYSSFGFFIKENLMFNVGPTYMRQVARQSFSHYSPTYPDTTFQQDDFEADYYGGEISIKKFFNLNSRLYWNYYFSSEYNYGSGKQEYRNVYTPDLRVYNIYSGNVYITAGAGFAYLVSDHWLLNGSIANLGWSAHWSKKTISGSSAIVAEDSRYNFGVNALYISLGVSLVLK